MREAWTCSNSPLRLLAMDSSERQRETEQSGLTDGGETTGPEARKHPAAPGGAYEVSDVYAQPKDLDVEIRTGLLLQLEGRALPDRFLDRLAANDRGTLADALACLAARHVPIAAQVHMQLDGEDAVVTLYLREHGEHLLVQIGEIAQTDHEASAPTGGEAMQRRLRHRQLHASRSAEEIFWEWNVAHDVHHFSKDLAPLLGAGRPLQQLDGAMLAALMHPDDAARERSARERHLDDDVPYSAEFRLQAAGGEHWFRIVGEAWHNEHGAPLYMSGVLTDVDAAHRRDHELGERRAEVAHLAAELQEISTRLVHAQETERRHIARELHDQAGQTLTSAILELEFWRGKGVPVDEVDRVIDTVKQALGEVRNISLQLRPPLLDDAGLEAALRTYLERQAAAAKFDMLFSTEGQMRRLEPALEITGFRLVQEAVTNIIRHAGARHVDVLLRMSASELTVRVSDNGSGCVAEDAVTNASSGLSLGLISLKERAALVGGRCEFISSPAVGSIVLARLPIP